MVVLEKIVPYLSVRTAAAAAKLLQSCPILCNPTDGSPGILQARTLEWDASPTLGDLPDPRIEPVSPASPALQVYSLPLSHLSPALILYSSRVHI